MKGLFAFLLAIPLFTSATNRYFSAAGIDANPSGTQAAPWQTITKFNSVFAASAIANDTFFFRRGDRFYGAMKITRSGASNNPIVIAAYGTGAKPVIDGFQTLSSGWTDLGDGLYESATNPALSSTALNMLTIDGVSFAMGRYPNPGTTNKGYLKFEGHTSMSIVDNELPASPNWTGATLVIRDNRYIIEKTTVASHSGTTVNFSNALYYAPSNGFGYFFENDIRTLDQFGEWYYNKATKKVTVYLGDDLPSDHTIRVAAIDTVISMFNLDNVVFNGIAVHGANMLGMSFYSVNAGVSKVLNCDVLYSGKDGMFISNSSGMVASGNTVTDANIHAIYLSGESNYTVTNNNVDRIAIFPGMAGPINTNTGIRANVDNVLIEGNTVDSTGYIGIRFSGNNITVRKNFVQHYCMILDDGGGIYTSGGSTHTNRRIVSNIIINGGSAIEGTSSTGGATSGIYLDDNSNGLTVDSNTIYNNNLNGIFLHNNTLVGVTNNTIYSNVSGIRLVHNSPENAFRNMTINNNILFAKASTAATIYSQTDASDLSFALWGAIDGNYHARPLQQTTLTTFRKPSYNQNLTLPDFYTQSTFEQNGILGPKTYGAINIDDSVRFDYNATNSPVSVSLGGVSWIDVRGVEYSDPYTLQPFTSSILMRGEGVLGNIPPQSNAGADQVIYLPVDSAFLSGFAYDANGSVADIFWTQITGAAATIDQPDSLNTWVTGLALGTYIFRFTVTDDEGAIISDDITVTVLATPEPGSDRIHKKLKL